ncbi:MAG: efflux RND transporter periplasmic adaptor subunit [Methylococcales bacterium]|nr:efflux RND transporter periplasmic adaptor subunit [Methylococcales bacterium]
MTELPDPRLIRLTLLLQLESRARLAPAAELPYVIVNETSELLPYRQAILWNKASNTINAASGVVSLEKNSPYALWLLPVLKYFSNDIRADNIAEFSAKDLAEELAHDWPSWAPEYALWLPLPAPSGGTYVLVLFRETSWHEAELHLLAYLGEAYGYTLALSEANQTKVSWQTHVKGHRRGFIVGGLLLAATFFPIHQSVLAEAEVVPHQPNLVRAPLEGVVENFYVLPNESVSAGQKLFSLDKAQLQSRLNVAEETRDIAQTEYLQMTQQALLDPTVKAKLAGLKSKWDQQNSEADYVHTLLERCEVVANQSGVAVFDDPNDWLGRPVTQGEKILAIANPQTIDLEIRLPMDDLIELQAGDLVQFFSNVSPHQPLQAKLTYFSYRTSPTPADVMAYRLKAEFTEGSELPRLGYHGIAKLYGTRRPFLLWLLRKPLRTARLWLPW